MGWGAGKEFLWPFGASPEHVHCFMPSGCQTTSVAAHCLGLSAEASPWPAWSHGFLACLSVSGHMVQLCALLRTPTPCLLLAHLFFFPIFQSSHDSIWLKAVHAHAAPFTWSIPFDPFRLDEFPTTQSCKSLHFSFIFLSLNLGFPKSRTKTRIWEGIPAHLVRTWHREAGNGGEANHVLRGELRLWIIDPIPLVTL